MVHNEKRVAIDLLAISDLDMIVLNHFYSDYKQANTQYSY